MKVVGEVVGEVVAEVVGEVVGEVTQMLHIWRCGPMVVAVVMVVLLKADRRTCSPDLTAY